MEMGPLAIPNKISKISKHIPSLMKILWYLLKLWSRKENMDVWQADNSVKNWRNRGPLAILNKICTISIHIISLMKIHWHLLKLSSRNKNMDVWCADNSVKNWWNLPISNPKQIYTISMHTSSLVKIHLCLLSYHSETKYGWTYDRWTDRGHTDNQSETIITRSCRVVWYKMLKSLGRWNKMIF